MKRYWLVENAHQQTSKLVVTDQYESGPASQPFHRVTELCESAAEFNYIAIMEGRDGVSVTIEGMSMCYPWMDDVGHNSVEPIEFWGYYIMLTYAIRMKKAGLI